MPSWLGEVTVRTEEEEDDEAEDFVVGSVQVGAGVEEVGRLMPVLWIAGLTSLRRVARGKGRGWCRPGSKTTTSRHWHLCWKRW